MKLIWDDKNKDRGVYKLTLTTDEGSKQEITLWDYACPYRQEQLERDFGFNTNFLFGFVISYCHGYSMEESFPNTWTLEQVKIWAEDYLLDKYINHYKNVLEELKTLKKNAEQAQAIKESRRQICGNF